MEPIRVLLADDHKLFRAGISALLQKMAGIVVAGEAATGREALRLVQVREVDVVLMDIMMPEMNGLDAAARVTRQCPKVRVIILSMNAAEEYVVQAFRAGAAGYLLKNVSPAEVELAIKTVVRGETFLSSTIARHVVAGYLKRFNGRAGPLECLTPRQREVLQLVAEGNKTKEIAGKLKLSARTVETFRTQIMRALDIHDVPGLVRYAIRSGLISADI